MLNGSSKSKKPAHVSVRAVSQPEGVPGALNPKRKLAGYPWGIFGAFLLILGSFILLPIISQLVVSLVPYFAGWDTVRSEHWTNNSAFANFLYVLVVEALTVGSILGFIRLKKQRFIETVGLRWPRWRHVGYALAGIVAYFGLFAIVLTVIGELLPIDTSKEQAIGFERGIGGLDLALAFVSLVVLPPIVEEIVFRGFLFGTLRGRGVALAPAVIVTSVFFGALHLFGSGDGSLLWIAFIDTFVLSIVLCYMREKTGDIWASILIHALKNSFVFVNLFVINA